MTVESGAEFALLVRNHGDSQLQASDDRTSGSSSLQEIDALLAHDREHARHGERSELDSCAIPVIGRGAFIKNKRAAGRAQEIADVKALDTE